MQVENLYNRAVKIHGNQKVKAVINQVFETVDSNWRGIGEVKGSADKVLAIMRSDPLGQEAGIIGEVVVENDHGLYLETDIGGTRILNMPTGELLPRIC